MACSNKLLKNSVIRMRNRVPLDIYHFSNLKIELLNYSGQHNMDVGVQSMQLQSTFPYL